MKKLLTGISIICFVVSLGSNLFAEEKRVIEEQLVLKDPTVSAENKWAVGGSFEYWYLSGPYKTIDRTTGKTVATGSIKGDMPGGNIFVGYDDFTLQYSYRPGDFDITKDFVYGYTVQEKQKQKENEITFRYLFRGKVVSPYLLVGYNDISLKTRQELTTAGWTWIYNGKTVMEHEKTYKSVMAGIGLILPVYRAFGLRGDARLTYTKAESIRDDGWKVTGSGAGFYGTLTGYLNIYKGINLQVGTKYQYLNGGDIGWYTKGGTFASLGYTYRF